MSIFLASYGVAIFLLICGWCYCQYQIDASNKKLKRINDLYNVRLFILYKYGIEAFEKLPPYDEMVESKIPAHVEFWI